MNRILYKLLIISLVLMGISKLFLFYYDRSYPEEHIRKAFDPIISKYGVEVVYEVDEDFLSSLVNPALPAGPARHSKVKPIRHRVLMRYPDLLRSAFEKYPVRVIDDYLYAIHIAGDINQDGFRYSGSVDPYRKVIFLVDDGWKDDQQAVRTFHHEFSSLLISGNTFLLNPWLDNNPKNFKYLVKRFKSWDDINTTGQGGLAEYTEGFVTDYGRVSFENDFNEYSAMILTYPDKFKNIMQQYPRVRGKFLIWLEFYQKIDPIFTEEYLLGKK